MFLTGCVEHIIYININPKGNFNIDYKCQSDLEYITNFDYLIPNLPNWEITSSISKKNSSYLFSANKNYYKDEIISTNLISNNSLIKYPVKIKKTHYFLFDIIKFNGVFKNRQINLKYPKVEQWINKIDKNPNGMFKEILQYIIEQTIFDCNLGFNIFPIVKNDIDKWFNNNINPIQDSIIFINFDEYLNEGSNIIQSNLTTTFINIDSIINIYKQEIDLTLNLIDTNFKMRVKLPNYILYHNADTLIDGIFYWNFSINNFLNTNKNFYVYSYNIFYKKILILFISIISLYILKKYIDFIRIVNIF